MEVRVKILSGKSVHVTPFQEQARSLFVVPVGDDVQQVIETEDLKERRGFIELREETRGRDRLMTSANRLKRHTPKDLCYSRCDAALEDSNHLFRLAIPAIPSHIYSQIFGDTLGVALPRLATK
ncbi:uncharacterized protein A4U43_C10F8680 [Asparagus officinalis]|uniref:Uncharacterized protein n=1 Tax=Asparagus officinalis TaxID=4686 RepID=A0A5P1E609_ASPOF|nr:uncharacterized protein A4U43_C10F8680 [Asparagus officinalis]